MPGRHFLREHRKAKGLTLEQVAERIELLSMATALGTPDARPISMTHATLSRVERGKIPYNEILLELLAEIYGTDVPSLLMRDPTPNQGGPSLWSVWDQLKPVQREQLLEMAKVLQRTGT